MRSRRRSSSFVSTPGTEGGTLVDQLSDLRVPVANEDAAYEFIRTFNRELPDYSPISEVPPEIMGSNPHAANPGDDLEPIYENPHTNTRDSMDRIAARVDRQINRMIEEVEKGAALTQHPAPGTKQVAKPDAFPCDRCGAEMFRMHAVWRCPSCGYKTDCCGW